MSDQMKNPQIDKDNCCTENQVCECPEAVKDRPVHQPDVDIRETESAVYLTADLPGVDEKNLELTIDKNVLTIIGKTDLPEFAEYELAYGEFSGGDYQRTFRLSDTLDTEKVEATIQQGVLQVTLPKAESVQPQKITVKAF